MKHDFPIFPTGKEKIAYIEKYQTTEDRETEMMLVRWKYFEFKKEILGENCVNIFETNKKH